MKPRAIAVTHATAPVCTGRQVVHAATTCGSGNARQASGVVSALPVSRGCRADRRAVRDHLAVCGLREQMAGERRRIGDTDWYVAEDDPLGRRRGPSHGGKASQSKRPEEKTRGHCQRRQDQSVPAEGGQIAGIQQARRRRTWNQEVVQGISLVTFVSSGRTSPRTRRRRAPSRAE